MPSVLCFEDYPHASENDLFFARMRLDLKKTLVTLSVIRSVSAFEDEIRKLDFDIVVLDIMASASSIKWTGTDDKVPDTMTGIELLRRCRNGEYGNHYKTTPIFMRTARGELSIRHLCDKEGATLFFQAGTDDKGLLEAIKTYFQEFGQKLQQQKPSTSD